MKKKSFKKKFAVAAVSAALIASYGIPTFADNTEVPADANEPVAVEQSEEGTVAPAEEEAAPAEEETAAPVEAAVGADVEEAVVEPAEEATPESKAVKTKAVKSLVAINETNFPDSIFRNYVKAKFDKDSDGSLSEDEANAVTEIAAYTFSKKGATSLKGIEYFPNLAYLSADYCDIGEIDVSKNTKLIRLSISNNATGSTNHLSELDVSKNIALKELDLRCNKTLGNIDISKNVNLEELICDQIGATKFDFSNNPKLKHLDCSQNPVTELDFSNNPELFKLDASNIAVTGSSLEKLDLSKNTALDSLYVYNSNIKELDVSKCTELDTVSCEKNMITELDLSNCNVTQSRVTPNNNLLYQNETSLIYKKDGKWIVDLKKHVAKSNLSRIDSVTAGSFDSSTGLVTFDTKPTSVTYKYKTGAAADPLMPVTLALSEAYAVVFDSNGGSSIDEQIVKLYNQAEKPEDPTRTGYTFNGWKDAQGNDYDFDTPVTGEVTLVADWTKNLETFTITFDSNGGSSVDEQRVEENSKIEKPEDPTKEGYTFNGWKDAEGNDYDFDTPVIGELTLVADWTKQEVSKPEDKDDEDKDDPDSNKDNVDDSDKDNNNDNGKTDSNKDNQSGENNNAGQPKTGDQSDMMAWLALALAGTAAGTTLVAKRKSSKEDK